MVGRKVYSRHARNFGEYKQNVRSRVGEEEEEALGLIKSVARD